jgi:hypothetical protein
VGTDEAQDKDYVNETLSIPRRYHRALLGEKAIFIHDIETKTNSRVRFPDKETASDVVTIFGPESQVQIAAAMLLVRGYCSVELCSDVKVGTRPLRSRHGCPAQRRSSQSLRIRRLHNIC